MISFATPGEPGHETWPGDSWQRGCADAWGGLSIDRQTATVFAAPGNPCPDQIDTSRKGKNLYSDSVVALDVSSGSPKLKWYYQISPGDTHDTDPAMPPVLFTGIVEGKSRALVTQKGLDTAPTTTGSIGCPNHGGGVECNGQLCEVK